jgi:hypothetical protein
MSLVNCHCESDIEEPGPHVDGCLWQDPDYDPDLTPREQLTNLGRSIASTKGQIDKLQRELREMQDRFDEKVVPVRSTRRGGHIHPIGRAAVVPQSLGRRGYTYFAHLWLRGEPPREITAWQLDWPAEDVSGTDTALYYEAVREHVSREQQSRWLPCALDRIDAKTRLYWIRLWDGKGGSQIWRYQIWVFRRLPACTEAWKLPEAGGAQ